MRYCDEYASFGEGAYFLHVLIGTLVCITFTDVWFGFSKCWSSFLKSVLIAGGEGAFSKYCVLDVIEEP